MNQEHPVRGGLPAPGGYLRNPVIWVSVACLICGLGTGAARQLLRYERQGILAGEVWRLVTAHLVHLGWTHLWLNLVALAVLSSLFADVMSRRDWWLGLLMSALCIDVGLLLLDPAVLWYVGLSGALHGIIVLGGLRLLGRQTAIALILLIGTALKLVWEQWQGPLPFTESAAAGPVLVDAHLYGAVGGGLTFTAIWLVGRLRGSATPL